MGLLKAALIVVIFTVSVEVLLGAKHVKNPMVAFLCNKPARYLKEDTWQTDTKTDCLHDPVDILNYCRKVYPHLDVTNIMESSHEMTIDNWCNFHGKCHPKHQSHTVRPYRCLVGPFQSEALLVPEHCIFDHIEGNNECKSYDQWNETSAKSCAVRGKVQQSFAPLRPCKVGRFDGVEFVCCPGKAGDALNYFKQKHDLVQDHHSHKPVHIVSGILSKHNVDDIGDIDTANDVKTTSAKPSTEKKDLYADYIHNPDDKPSGVSEHEYFQNAKKMLVKHHHEKVTKMMKEWAAARQHVHDMKLTDPKGSDKLNKEITARFQKTYEALEEEGDAEKKQLIAIHQQRVQAKLNVKKRHSMEHYMAVLTEPKPDAAKILKALKHYLRVEEKDRVHSINHFKHIRDTENADAAEIVRQRTMTHLKILTQRIQQAIDMLSRVPTFEKKIRAQIDTFLQTFHNVDVLVANLIEKPDKTNNDKILRKYKQELQQTKTSKHEPDNKSVKDATTAAPAPAVLHHVSLEKTPPVLHANKFDDETMEDEHNLPTVDIKKSSHVAHMSVSQLKLQEQAYVKKEPMKGANAVQTGSTLGIVIGSITVFIVIVVGVVILRQRSMTPSSRGFVEVAQNASVEERHVTKMQMNGYENPTYKYFEAQPGVPAATNA